MKKAQFTLTHELMIWSLRIFLIVVVLIVLILATYMHLTREVKTGDFEKYVLLSNLFYSNCINSENGRINPGVIDLTKFNPISIQNCFSYNKEKAAIKLTLTDFKNEKISEATINEDLYNELNELCPLQEKIPEEDRKHNCYDDKKYILVDENNGLKQAMLSTKTIIKT